MPCCTSLKADRHLQSTVALLGPGRPEAKSRLVGFGVQKFEGHCKAISNTLGKLIKSSILESLEVDGSLVESKGGVGGRLRASKELSRETKT